MPVHEQRWTGFLHPVEPINTAALVPRQWFVLLTSPTLELQVKMIEDLAHRRSVESPVVVPPPSEGRVVLL